MVEFLTEGIELSLLGPQGPRWGTGRFGLEGSVHTFMSSVLLGLSRLNEFRKDAQPDPPGGELGQPGQGIGRKRHTVIGPDATGKSILLEDPCKYGFGVLYRSRMKSLAGNDIPGTVIGNGKWVAVDPVPGFELSLEVRRPQVVGSRSHCVGLSGMSDLAPVSALFDQMMSFKDVADRGAMG